MYEEIFNQIRSAANKRNLKDSTIHAYCTSVAHFLNHTAKDIDALTTDDVDIFLTEKKLSGISPETYNHYHSGIRFFYKKILKKNWDDDDIPRMKRDRKLPTVLTKTEISAILDATPNLKHKAMIATMYSGLCIKFTLITKATMQNAVTIMICNCFSAIWKSRFTLTLLGK